VPEPDRGFLLAHFSDPHIAPLPPASLRDLSSKRILGFLSWRYRRRHLHRLENLNRLAADVIAQVPDHVAITGDLTNISLPSEFVQAAEWLKGFGAADWVTVIPGNHDAYVRQPWAQSWALWADYMSGDKRPHRGFDDFPFVRRRDRIAIIGLSSAVPTLWCKCARSI